jgi:hypothetical protein
VLTHNGGALKVDEGSGNAGMGWNVALGGSIFREVRGLPDEINADGKTGWLINGNGQTIQNLGNSTDYSFINGLAYSRDTEPDIYYFNAPGLSGRFIYGADGAVKLIPYQDVKITMGSQIIIQTNTGITYTFQNGNTVTRKAVQFKPDPKRDIYREVDLFKRVYNYYTKPVNFTNTWDLVRISSSASAAAVDFSYKDGNEGVSSEFVTSIAPNAPTRSTTKVDTLYSIQDTTTPKQLVGVNLKNFSIEVTWNNSLIDGIKFSEKESQEVKEYRFYYKTIYYANTNDRFNDVGKPFLLHVKEVNSATCTAFPSFVFSYVGVDTTNLYDRKKSLLDSRFGNAPVDWKRGWGQDVFGYFNGKINNKNIPSVYYYPDELNSRKLRVSPIADLIASQQLNGVDSSFSQLMNVDPLWNSFGALYKIDYPTGGATFINYEPNRYLDATTGEELLGPGVRVGSISTSGGEAAYNKNWKANGNQFHSLTKSYMYVQENGSSSGLLLYPPSFGFTNGNTAYRTQSNQAPTSQLFYTTVKEVVDGQGYRVYEFDVPNIYPDATSTVTQIAYNTGGTTSSGTYGFPFAPLEELDFKRGFPKRISEYTQAGVLTQERRTSYAEPKSDSYIQALRYEPLNDVNQNEHFYFSLYKIPINQTKIVQTETVKMVSDSNVSDSTKAVTSYTYNDKNMVTQTTQTNDDNSILTTSIKYALDYPITAPKAGDIQANALFKLNSSNRYTEVIESIQKFTPRNGTPVVAGAKLSLFKEYGGNIWPFQVRSFPQLASIIPSFVVEGTTQGFKSDANYILENTIDYANSVPVNQVGLALVPKGVHYAVGIAAPVATFLNCKAENAVYDGFEFSMSRGLQYGATLPTFQNGRTGKRAVLLTKASTFTSNLSAPIAKAGNSYRLSCWVFASQAGSILMQAKNGNTVQSSATLTYSTPNVWAYLEGTLNTTSVASSFTLSITTTSAVGILLDDFVAMPATARVSFSTFRPFVGATSQTDDRGNSNVVNYDPMGRKTATLDKQRNMVQLQEYGQQREGAITLSASFSSNTSKYVQGQQVLFSARQQCAPQVSYDWVFYENGTETYAQGKDVYKTFSSFGEVKVHLTVSSPGYTSVSTIESLCINTSIALSLTVSLTPEDLVLCPTCNPANNNPCERTISNVRIFRPSLSPFKNMRGWNVSYHYIVKDTDGNEIARLNTLRDISGEVMELENLWMKLNKDGTLETKSPLPGHQVECFVTLAKKSNFPYSSCNEDIVTNTGVAGVVYINNTQCE